MHVQDNTVISIFEVTTKHKKNHLYTAYTFYIQSYYMYSFGNNT